MPDSVAPGLPPPCTYDPRTTRLLSFVAARRAFAAGEDTPRALLERCLAMIDAVEPTIGAFVATNLEGARAAADAATARWRAGRPASVVDGLPIGIKDLYQTADMPTQMNSPVYAGWNSGMDAACVHALRRGGAAIVAKTATTEFGIGAPPRTRNPFDPSRTPGGSSSGSAAAVGARMLPAALGTQLKGSVIRPAAYCANYAMKTSFGAINRGGGHSTSPSGSHLGVHAGTLADAWAIAQFLSTVAGPDPGFAGLSGGPELPAPVKPRRLMRVRSPGWALTDPGSQATFERFLDALRAKGVEIVEPEAAPATAAFEEDTHAADDIVTRVLLWEMRWPMQIYAARGGNMLSERVAGLVAKGETLTVDDYRRALADRARFRSRHMALAASLDGFVSPASPGPAPVGIEATGNPVYQTWTSALGAPSFTLPLLAEQGMPFGVQLVGFTDGDERLAAHAAWIDAAFAAG